MTGKLPFTDVWRQLNDGDKQPNDAGKGISLEAGSWQS
jgi:hypothetical protein